MIRCSRCGLQCMRCRPSTGIESRFNYIVAMMRIAMFLTCCLTLIGGCNKGGDSTSTSSGSPSVQLTLDWKPEPEFGGFYAAQQDGAFSKHAIDVKIQAAGEGADTWQLVATGRTEFATSSADQVLIARKQNADVIAIFAVYQTFPQGIMVHQSRGFTSIKDVFSHDGVLLAEDTVAALSAEEVRAGDGEDHGVWRRDRRVHGQEGLFAAVLRDF